MAAVLEEQHPARTNRAWPTLFVLAALWLLNINQLRVEWAINPQYAYGWTVPLLALYLFAERWKCRPPVAPAHFSGILAFVVALLALSLLPLRFIQEAAPDWRMINWALALSATAISLCAVYFAGGRSWLAHFAIPLCFILVAVPWPMPLEKVFVQGLMHLVARICVEALSFFAIPAIQHGNIIEISTGRVGVEEACSGVRSLQTTLMAALFLGELFRFGLVRRGLLLVGGLALAFVCNLGRSFFLVWVSAHEGPASALKWHDSVGVSVLIASLVGLAALCVIVRPSETFDAGKESPDEPPWRARFAPTFFLVSFAIWLALVELGSEWWYRSHETGRSLSGWSVHWPASEPAFRMIPLPESTEAMLRCDEGKTAAWRGADGYQWQMIFLRWMPGRASAQLARSHGPEVCLAANGAVLREDLGVKTMRVAGFDLPMHGYIFTVRGTPLYVYYCLWEDYAADLGPQSTRQDMTSASKLDAVFKGRRNTGQQVIEVAVAGPADAPQAEAATAALLAGVIKP